MVSTGIAKIFGPRRTTPFSSSQVGLLIAKRLRIITAAVVLLVLRSAINKHIKASSRTIIKHFHRLCGICSKIPKPHNGLRSPKKRRL